MKKQKGALIDALYQQIASNHAATEQIKKDFKMDDKEFEKIVKKIFDTWLDSPDMIMMLSEAFGVYAADPEETSEEDDGDQDYLG